MNLPAHIITCSPPTMNLPAHDTVKHLMSKSTSQHIKTKLRKTHYPIQDTTQAGRGPTLPLRS